MRKATDGYSAVGYRRDCLLGCVGALLMLVGDLSLSVIPAYPGDSGLFARGAYFDGSYETWRLPLLLCTGTLGMILCSFAARALCRQIDPRRRVMRLIAKLSGVIYITSAGVIHLLIGSLADWTSRLSPIIGSEETMSLVMGQYERVAPALIIPYAGMVVMMLLNAFALLTKRTFLPRWSFIFHMLVWQLVFVLIPDIRQALGCVPATLDFVLSQGSGNAALFIWMLANVFLANKYPTEESE